jgi:hypothetical protein
MIFYCLHEEYYQGVQLRLDQLEEQYVAYLGGFRQFIRAGTGCRMIVLKNEVIATAEFTMNKDDFKLTGVDIPYLMVKYLMAKSQVDCR